MVSLVLDDILCRWAKRTENRATGLRTDELEHQILQASFNAGRTEASEQGADQNLSRAGTTDQQ